MKQLPFSGHSMFPAIKNGDILFLQSIPIKDIKIGNIICILKNDIYVAHRVISIDSANNQIIFILKGDNLKHRDPRLIIENQKLYKVIAIKRNDNNIIKVNNRSWMARLSSHNLTYGIIRAEIGKIVKRVSGI
jgi:signal peptidase I